MMDTWEASITFIVYTDLGERLVKYWTDETSNQREIKLYSHRLTSLNSTMPSYIPFRDIESEYYHLNILEDGAVDTVKRNTKIGDIADVDVLILLNGWTVDSADRLIGGFHSHIDDYLLETLSRKSELGYMPSILSLNKRNDGKYYSQSPICYSRAKLGWHYTSETYWDWYLNLLIYEGLIRKTSTFRMLPNRTAFGNAHGFSLSHPAPHILQ